MSIGLVCTKHEVSLRPQTSLTLPDLLVPGLFLDCEDLSVCREDPDHYHEYSIDTSEWYCPKDPNNNACAQWHAAVLLDTGGPLDESFERSMHPNWYKED